MNEAAGVTLVEASTGGPGGGGASVTAHGRRAIRLYRTLVARFARAEKESALTDNPLATDSDGG
jgi:molybdate transport system regulatory protein